MISRGRFLALLSYHLPPSLSLYGFLPLPWLPGDSDHGYEAEFHKASKTSYTFNLCRLSELIGSRLSPKELLQLRQSKDTGGLRK